MRAIRSANGLAAIT